MDAPPGTDRSLARQRAQSQAPATRTPFPLLWPRRTAGAQLRLVVLAGPASDAVATASLEALATLPANRFDVTIAVPSGSPPPAPVASASSARPLRVVALAPIPDANDAKRLAMLDADVLVDLAGLSLPAGALLAYRPARKIVTVAGIALPRVTPPFDETAIPAENLRAAMERFHGAIDQQTDVPDAPTMLALWENTVRAHQRGDAEAARAGYEHVLRLQPGHAPAHFLRGVLLRDRGDMKQARAQFDASVAAAPGYVDARVAAANAAQAAGDVAAAIELCITGLELEPGSAPLARTLGLAQLAAGDGAAATAAFERALALAPEDADTRFNLGAALQRQGRGDDAVREYHRALALNPDLVDARFNLGTVHQERGQVDSAVRAYDAALRADPTLIAAYRNLGEVLFAAGRIDAWLANFRRFEARCPDALPLMVQALEASHYLADFAKLDSYLERIATGRFVVRDDVELADCLEQLLYLLLFFDVAPEITLRLARTYDAAARRVYGEPLPRKPVRKPGRLRVGYLSADLRNHVMGKMMWQALQHHDKERFELYFYSLSTTEDEWTERFRALADHYEVVARLSERAAAERMSADDLDLLVDLGTHTKGARPGILALKPARVQLTHVASAGTVGLSTVDFKLTDRYADLPANDVYQIEKLLPMDGCVYPYRHIVPLVAHSFRRPTLGIAADAVVIGAFVTGLKLSRRCLGLWHEILAIVPRAVIAFSPVMEQQRALYLRLTGAAGIPADRVVFIPQGRDDAENQARYALVDFVLDPMPYGGTNGTLEALDMGVPVVTLVGTRHGERTSFSILCNLGVAQTIAYAPGEYVAIARRLADDPAFTREVRAAIASGLGRSPLTDGAGHTRALERAYVAALAAGSGGTRNGGS